MIRRTAAALLLGILLAATGCGYSAKSTLDPKYQTVHVSAFYDESPQYDLQAPLSNALIRKFINDNRLEVTDEQNADLLIEGKILNYSLRGLTYDQNDEVTQFLVVITASVRVTDTETNQVLWQEALMSGETSYYTRAAGQSSDRLRGNAEVFLPTVRSFATEEENRAASEALEQLASDIFYRTIEPW